MITELFGTVDHRDRGGGLGEIEVAGFWERSK